LPDGGGPGLHYKPLDGAIGQAFILTASISHAITGIFEFAHDQLIEKGLKVKGWPLMSIGV
jgi:hypothetical protein